MKKFFFTIIFISIFACAATAQTKQHREIRPQGDRAREMLEQKKRDYFSKQMELTESEAKVFFPVFDKYEQTRREIGRERSKILRQFSQNKATVTDSEAKEINSKLIELQKREYNLFVDYQKTFETILSPKKLLMMNKAQDDFQRQLLRSMRNQKSAGEKREQQQNIIRDQIKK